jgi:hypothetical protein
MTAAFAEYKELKARYYGAQAYDFSETGLLGAAQASMTRPDDALAFLRMNTELFPRSARTYVAMAQAQALKNDTAGAIKSLEQALTLDPQNVAARRQLYQLKR